MWLKSALFQKMLPMGRFPAFGQPRPPPQSRMIRTINFKWCDKQSILREHREIASGDVIWSSETSSSYQISRILESVSDHFIYIGNKFNHSLMMSPPLLNSENIIYHHSATPGKRSPKDISSRNELLVAINT